MKSITIGMDLGDKNNTVCVLDSQGNIVHKENIENTQESILKFMKKFSNAKVAIEAGTHSPWISRLLTGIGQKVLVGNPRKLRSIWQSEKKDDMRDAEMLARIARFDPDLLYPIQHKSKEAQADMSLLHTREALIKQRSSLINHIRGTVKSFGARIAGCSTESFHKQALSRIPEELQTTLCYVLEVIEALTLRIKIFDKKIEAISQERYPETELLRKIKGVGPITALTYILTLEDPHKFTRSRQVGSYLGLVPRRDQSGETDKQLHITKAGSPYLRKLLVNCAQYILGHFGEDCDLRRFGLRIASRGGKNAQRRAVVAVARKLSVLMHRLWKNGEIYDPLYMDNLKKMKRAA